ncbi:MAG: peptidylprolyl isomerase [Candidatus Omnitrophica bacterium]|nr:peptidylprolyl isomerase [Candidatus Omnitrophota bacterium]
MKKLNIKRITVVFKNRKTRRIIIILLAAALVSSAVFFLISSKNRNVLAVVNGYRVTVSDLMVEVEVSPAFYKEFLKANPQAVLDDYINQVLLFREAKKYERELKKGVEGKMKNYYMKMLTQEYVEKKLVKKVEIADEEIAEYYNAHLEDFVIPERVRLFEIVLPSQQAAEAVRRRLSFGESFEELARRESITLSREKNGDLGWIDVRKLEPEISVLVTRINPGDILANIIKTEVGYHIIKLASKTERRMLTMQEASTEIRSMMMSQGKKREVDALIAAMREKGNIRVFPDRVEKLKTN